MDNNVPLELPRQSRTVCPMCLMQTMSITAAQVEMRMDDREACFVYEAVCECGLHVTRSGECEPLDETVGQWVAEDIRRQARSRRAPYGRDRRVDAG